MSRTCAPSNQSTKDVASHTQQIVLYAHQLRFTATLRSSDQRIGGEIFLTRIDCTDSLVDIARKLVSSVVMAVRVVCVVSVSRTPRKFYTSTSSKICSTSSTTAASPPSTTRSTRLRSWSINEQFFDDVFYWYGKSVEKQQSQRHVIKLRLKG